MTGNYCPSCIHAHSVTQWFLGLLLWLWGWPCNLLWPTGCKQTWFKIWREEFVLFCYTCHCHVNITNMHKHTHRQRGNFLPLFKTTIQLSKKFIHVTDEHAKFWPPSLLFHFHLICLNNYKPTVMSQLYLFIICNHSCTAGFKSLRRKKDKIILWDIIGCVNL